MATTIAPGMLPTKDRRNTLKSDFDKVKAQTMGRTRRSSINTKPQHVRNRKGTWVPKLAHNSELVNRERANSLRVSQPALQAPSPSKLATQTTPNNSRKKGRQRSSRAVGVTTNTAMDRTRSFTIGGDIPPNQSQEISNPTFMKELEELREILRSSQIKSQEVKEEESEKVSLEDEQKTNAQLRVQLDEALKQQEKLTAELRIERNLRLELEKTNKQQTERIKQLESSGM